MPPVSRCESAFRVNNDRSTAGDHSAMGLNPADQVDQNDSTWSKASAARNGAGAERKDGVQESVNPTSSPAETSNSPTVRKSSPRSDTVVSSNNRSGPAVSWSLPSSRRETHGTTEPYSNRTTSSGRIGTLPRTPLTRRTRSDAPSRRAMKSMTQTAP